MNFERSATHVFVVPDVDGPVTGGTLFNRMLIASLRQSNVTCRVCPRADASSELSSAGADDVIWIDSLFLDLLPDLARATGRRARLGLLLHYLPSLVHSGDDGRTPSPSRPETDALASADIVIVTSSYMRGVVERMADPRPAIVVIEPGRLSEGPVDLREPPLRAVMVANLLPGKGVLPFLVHLAEQARSSDHYELSIVGGASFDAAYAHRCQHAAEDPRLQHHVRLLGEQSPEATVRHMATCNLLVSASTMESFGMALAEARCLGLPIVANRGGNVQALVTQETGGEVVSDSTALAQAFLAICRNPSELRRRMDVARATPLPPRQWTTVAAELVEAVEAMKGMRATRPSHVPRSGHVSRSDRHEIATELPCRELWFVGPGKLELRAGPPVPALVEGQVLARGLYSGISQGTELLLYRGEGPNNFDPSLDDVPFSPAPASSAYPRRYGYSWVGEVVESRLDGVEPGQRIFCLRPHGDVHVLRPGQFRVLPATVPSLRATLAANMETALNVIWDAGIALGDDVVVLGAGMVGLLVVLLAKRAGARRVHVVEPSARRRAAAAALGADVAIAPDQDEPRGSADVVVEATGDPAHLDRAILHAGDEATVLMASFYGERRSSVGLGSDFHRRRLQLKASQVSRVPPGKGARWNVDRRFERVLDFLCDSRLDAVLDPPVPFAQALALFSKLGVDASSTLQSTFSYREDTSPALAGHA